VGPGLSPAVVTDKPHGGWHGACWKRRSSVFPLRLNELTAGVRSKRCVKIHHSGSTRAAISPTLFVDGTQWWVSAGGTGDCGGLLFWQLRRDRGTRGL
jgi:hypothetical protein